MEITNDRIKDIVYESIYKMLNETKLFEYLIHREKYVDICHDLSYQIFENWCLIRYCTITNRELTKEHWKSELYVYLSKISRNGMKSNNTISSREKAIRQGFDMGDLFNITDSLYKSVKKKFLKENININDNLLSNILSDFSNSIIEIVHILSINGDIDEYIETI